jgi:hypothetical protein
VVLDWRAREGQANTGVERAGGSPTTMYTGQYDFWFVTDEPNAAPVNATVEVVPHGSVCE